MSQTNRTLPSSRGWLAILLRSCFGRWEDTTTSKCSGGAEEAAKAHLLFMVYKTARKRTPKGERGERETTDRAREMGKKRIKIATPISVGSTCGCVMPRRQRNVVGHYSHENGTHRIGVAVLLRAGLMSDKIQHFTVGQGSSLPRRSGPKIADTCDRRMGAYTGGRA